MKNSPTLRSEENIEKLEQLSNELQAFDVKLLLDLQRHCSVDDTIEDLCNYLSDAVANKQQGVLIKESFYPNP